MFLDRGADFPKEPRRYCGILFLILRVWFFSGNGGAGAPPAPPLLTPVIPIVCLLIHTGTISSEKGMLMGCTNYEIFYYSNSPASCLAFMGVSPRAHAA